MKDGEQLVTSRRSPRPLTENSARWRPDDLVGALVSHPGVVKEGGRHMAGRWWMRARLRTARRWATGAGLTLIVGALALPCLLGLRRPPTSR